MGIDAEKLDAETDAEFAKLMGQPEAAPEPDSQDKPQKAPAADDVPPPETVTEPELPVQQGMPAPDGNDDWQDKYLKAEESRKNAHALMTQATQNAAELERSHQQLQQEVAQLRAQLSQPSSAPSADPVQGKQPDQFQELREDYEELAPVFNTLDETNRRNQALEQRLAAIEQHRQQQEQTTEQERFWNTVREVHPDVDQVAQRRKTLKAGLPDSQRVCSASVR